MTSTKSVLAISLLLALVGTEAQAQSYSLRRPVPADKLRDLSTDRPDRTESPFTVDAGHYQVEMDAINFTDDVRGGVGTRSIGIGSLNVKVGLRSNVDLQIVSELYNIATPVGLAGGRESTSLTDVTGRLKINLWGNDGGRTAFALMPYVTAPAHAPAGEKGAVTGGIIMPLGIELGYGFGMGLMSELDFVRAESGAGYRVNTLHSVTVSRDIAGIVGAYAEVVAETLSEARTKLAPTGDFGITISPTSNLQFDVGANVGMNGNVARYTGFIGVSRRY